MHLICSIFVLHNFLIDTRDAVHEDDVIPPEIALQLRELESDVGLHVSDVPAGEREAEEEDEVAKEGQHNSCEPTRNALLRHIRWLDDVTDSGARGARPEYFNLD